LFDNIIPIPQGDLAIFSKWKIENRCKLLHVLPYDDAFVIDTDMLFLQDISHWFDFVRKYEIFFTTHVYTYRGEEVSSDFYRKLFTKHPLPNIYSGMHYISKKPLAYKVYDKLNVMVEEWDQLGGKIQKKCSIDVGMAIAVDGIDCLHNVSNSNVKIPYFTHMKANIQNLHGEKVSWIDAIGYYFTDNLELWVGNYQQSGVFHYTESKFLTNDIVSKYENYLSIS
jgi:hypothetical protein